MLLRLIKVSEFMMFQNVERFSSHEEKEKIPEKNCHRLVEVILILIEEALSQQDNNARVER